MLFKRGGLKKQFVTVFLVLITIPTLLFGVLIYYQATKAFKQQARENTIARLEKNEENLNSIIQEIETMSSFMIYDDDFRTFFMAGEEDTFQSEYKQTEKEIKGYLTFQLLSKNYIDSISLVGRDGHNLEFGNPVTGTAKAEEKLAINAKKGKGAPIWSNAYVVTSDWDGKKRVISLTRVINDLTNIKQPIGLVRIRLDQEKLYQIMETRSAHQQGTYFVLSENGHVVLHHDSSLSGKPFPISKVREWAVDSDQKTMSFTSNGSKNLVVKKEVKGTNWRAIAVVDEGDVVKSLYNVRGLIVNMILLLILLGIVAFSGFYYRHIKRISELTEQTKQLENGDFSAKVEVTSNDEIGKLGMRFNKMVVTIQNLINQEYKLKIKQKESELKALQSQIDPHFLYNTLDMIRWSARLENAMETGQQIERLSKVFRMNLNMGKMWVRIEEEMVYLENYLELQKSRLGERLEFRLSYDSDIKKMYIIKQLIQPLVENSILHGFKDLPRQGVIEISSYKRGNELWIDVVDNGWGIPDHVINKGPDATKNYALNNIKDRLEMAFGEGFGVEHINSEIGTWIRLKLPLLEDVQFNERVR
nr:sensor histidine kinase [Neobacillus sp. Marseille-Q6967]